jgi:hypothetical protein
MRYYNAAGSPVTPITTVSTAGSHSDVAASNGSFVITWVHDVSATNPDIDAERFVITGGVPVAQGVFVVNGDANQEYYPAVAMAPDGRFAIAYARQYSGNDWDIYADQYDQYGTHLRQVIVNADALLEDYPDIAMDNAGNAVITYERHNGSNWDVYAQRLSSGGTVSGLIAVANSTSANEDSARVALAPTGGRFVVAYTSGTGVQITELSASNARLATLGPVTAGSNTFLGLSIDGYNRYLVTYARSNSATGSYDIISRRDLLT